MDNHNEQPLLLTGGLIADELPEGRAIYDTNDKFQPTGRDLLNPLSWLPGPVGGISGGADAYHSARESGLNPLAAAAIGTGVGALGTFSLLGPMSKFLPKGKKGGYVRLGGNPGEIISENGRVYNVGNKVDREELIKDANAYEIPFRNGLIASDKYIIPPMDDWLTGVNSLDDSYEAVDKALEYVKSNPSVISERFMDNLDKQAINAYSKSVPELDNSIYKHYSKKPLSSIERGYTGIVGGDLLDVGPTSGVYMVDNGTNVKNLPNDYYTNRIVGPNKNSFLDFNEIPGSSSNLQAYKLLKDIAKRRNISFDNNQPIGHLYSSIRNQYPYVNRMLRNKGYAGLTEMLPETYDWNGNIFREYVGFRPEDYTILGSERYKGK